MIRESMERKDGPGAVLNSDTLRSAVQCTHFEKIKCVQQDKGTVHRDKDKLDMRIGVMNIV